MPLVVKGKESGTFIKDSTASKKKYNAYAALITNGLSAKLRNVCPSCYYAFSDLNRYGLTKSQ